MRADFALGKFVDGSFELALLVVQLEIQESSSGFVGYG
jgi:hypothetical protein